jgi:hypothetical protein
LPFHAARGTIEETAPSQIPKGNCEGEDGLFPRPARPAVISWEFSMTRSSRLCLSLATSTSILLTAAGTAQAGGTPENILLVVNPASPESMYLANYYRAKRNIPARNIVYIDPGATNYSAFAGPNGNIDAVLGVIRSRRLEDHIDYIVVAGTDRFYVDAPGLVTDGCFPVNRFSQSSVYTMAFLKDQLLAGSVPSSLGNQYSSINPSAPLAFDSSNSYLSGNVSTSANARRYFIGAQLGYTGSLGNTLSDIFAMIDSSVAADGTQPAGKFYYMNNLADPIRNIRACGSFAGCNGSVVNFTSAINAITAAGGTAEIISAVLPAGRHDCLGVLTGDANPDIDGENMTLLPGAFADHLTSWAATFDNSAQTKMSAWIRRGASGTSGTVEEPCAYPGKFPFPSMHAQYFRGLSLGEAHLRSLSYVPFQHLFLGDPMTRPFATFPTVSATVPPGPVSGVFSFTPSASTALPGASINRVEVLVDGVLRASSETVGPVSFSTQPLADGPHEVRVLAYDNTVIRNVGRWTGVLSVNNHGRVATLQMNTTSGNLGTAFTATVASPGSGTVQEVRLLQNGRVVAARPSAGTMTVYGHNLGAGESSVRAEIIYTDGRRAVSAPTALNVGYTGTGTPAAPVAHSYTVRVYRGGSAVIELPASFPASPQSATYAVTAAPTQSTIGGGTMNYRVITAPFSAAGTDTLLFTVQTPAGTSNTATVTLIYTDLCYANCDGSVTAPVLNVADFSCFLLKFAAGDPYANCDGSTSPPVLNVADFSCFLTNFAAGCD